MIKHLSIPLILCCGLASNLLGFSQKILAMSGYMWFLSQAEMVISTFITSTKKTFILISGIEASLSVLETVQVGINFIIEFRTELGQVFSSVIRLLSLAWKMSLASLTSLICLEYLLKVIHWLIIPSTTVILISLLLAWGVKQINFSTIIFKRLSVLLIALSFNVFVLLPLVMIGTGSLVNQLHEAHTEKIQSILIQEHQSLTRQIPTELNKDTAYKTKALFKLTKQTLAHKLDVLSETVPRYLVLTLMDIVIFPLGVLAYFFFSTRFIFRYFTTATSMAKFN